jgi:drug/metabolite transporter (DMT)-like permease
VPAERRDLVAPPVQRIPPGGGRAIAFMLGATLLFSCMNATAKALGTGYSALQLIFFRNLFALLPLGLVLLRGDSLADLKTRRPLGHMLRAVAGLVSLGCFFFALPRLPLATVVAISFAAPLFVAGLSRPMLGERVQPPRFAAIAVGFSGVLVILQPTAGGLDPSILVAVIATLLYALVMIFMRQLNRTETPTAIVFYYLVSSVALSGMALPFVWMMPDLQGWLLFGALGLFGGFAQLLMTTAFRHGDAALVAPFDYATILWSTAIGWLVWAEWPGPHLLLGGAIVVGSGLYLTRCETRVPRDRA